MLQSSSMKLPKPNKINTFNPQNQKNIVDKTTLKNDFLKTIRLYVDNLALFFYFSKINVFERLNSYKK